MDTENLRNQIKKTLQSNLFDIVNDTLTDEKFVVVSNFGEELRHSTFYIDKKHNIDAIIIGAHISLDNRIVTKTLMNKIQIISTQYNVACSPAKYDAKNDTGIVSMKVVYSFVDYDEVIFMSYVNNFRECIKTLYNNIYGYVKYQDFVYIDLSMFTEVDWSSFDPYYYIAERDKKYFGSWDKYIDDLLENHALQSIVFNTQICKRFEEINKMPIDMVCDYIVEQMMLYNSTIKDKIYN